MLARFGIILPLAVRATKMNQLLKKNNPTKCNRYFLFFLLTFTCSKAGYLYMLILCPVYILIVCLASITSMHIEFAHLDASTAAAPSVKKSNALSFLLDGSEGRRLQTQLRKDTAYYSYASIYNLIMNMTMLAPTPVLGIFVGFYIRSYFPEGYFHTFSM